MAGHAWQVPYCVKFYPPNNNQFITGMSDNRLYTFDCTSGTSYIPTQPVGLLVDRAYTLASHTHVSHTHG
jgi:hypothetical protein